MPLPRSSAGTRNSNPPRRRRRPLLSSEREDDWTCRSCGNVNFSFRTTCNIHSQGLLTTMQSGYSTIEGKYMDT